MGVEVGGWVGGGLVREGGGRKCYTIHINVVKININVGKCQTLLVSR